LGSKPVDFASTIFFFCYVSSLCALSPLLSYLYEEENAFVASQYHVIITLEDLSKERKREGGKKNTHTHTLAPQLTPSYAVLPQVPQRRSNSSRSSVSKNFTFCSRAFQSKIFEKIIQKNPNKQQQLEGLHYKKTTHTFGSCSHLFTDGHTDGRSELIYNFQQ